MVNYRTNYASENKSTPKSKVWNDDMIVFFNSYDDGDTKLIEF